MKKWYVLVVSIVVLVPILISIFLDTTNSDTLYKVAVDNVDFWELNNAVYSYNVENSRVKKTYLINFFDNTCYYSQQIVNDVVTTLQGECEYSVNDDKVIIEGNFTKLVTSVDKYEYADPNYSNTKEQLKLEFEIGTNGKTLKNGTTILYNSSYKSVSNDDYIFIKKTKSGNNVYNEEGTCLVGPCNLDNSNDLHIDFADYNVKEVSSFPN